MIVNQNKFVFENIELESLLFHADFSGRHKKFLIPEFEMAIAPEEYKEEAAQEKSDDQKMKVRLTTFLNHFRFLKFLVNPRST